MSYDLQLRRPEGRFLPTAVVSDRIVSLGNVDGNGLNFVYKHPQTGVYCVFDVEDDYVLVSLNLMRPRFFGMEAMPLISRLADEAGLEIFDPQQDRVVVHEELLDLWLALNEQAIRSLKPDLPYLEPEKSLYWWQWMRDKDALQEKLGPSIFVPQIFLLADQTRRVRTAAVWPANVEKAGFFQKKRFLPLPQVFPECDYLILAAGDDRRYVARQEAAGQLGETVRPEDQERAGKVFGSLKTAEAGKVERIGPDGFVDVA